jgi:F-type H+-transporting ATPase subunit delta
MAKKGKNESAAGQFAQAILELAIPRNLEESVDRELSVIKGIVQSMPTFKLFLKDPSMSESEKRRVLDAGFEGKVCEIVLNALRVMNRHGRLGLIGDIADEYHKRLDTHMGRVKVRLVSAAPLDPDLTEQVRQSVGQALGKTPILESTVNPNIIGGLVLQVGDKLIDGSVKKQIELMKNRLLAASHK